MNSIYFEVSAKSSQNINEFFEGATKIFLINYIKSIIKTSLNPHYKQFTFLLKFGLINVLT